MEILIGDKKIGGENPTYFIADIAANHDGDLSRAKHLIHLAKDAGADAAKFQNFRAEQIVSDYGFTHLDGQQSHQSKWRKSVFEVYKDATVPFDWTPYLKEECDKVGIHYFSSPYDFGAIDMLEPYVPAYKVGSGDINWHEALVHMASKGKPILLATGASDIGEVQKAVDVVSKVNRQLVIMQCNTNYTGNLANFCHIHLNVLKTYALMFPDAVLGLSDHTPGHATVLGAVALGARVIEKHFTDDSSRLGPDHAFSMIPSSWTDMVQRTRELELALGSASKFVAGNETETVVIQRRCLRAARDIAQGKIFTAADLDVLRPAAKGGLPPYEMTGVIGRKAAKELKKGQEISRASVVW